METCPAANPDHSPNKPKPCPEVGSKARSAHREPIVGAALSRRMRASYPAKSQTLRPGVGPPTESKLKSKPKRPPPAVTCFFCGSRAPRRTSTSCTQEPKASPRGRASHRIKSSKAKQSAHRPHCPAFLWEARPRGECGRQPANRTTQSAQPAAAGRSSPQSHLPAHTRSPLRAAIPEPADNRPAPPP